jgi:hypothetical protein
MLRILLIILVALAVIIGLMRLTGAKPGDAAPAAASDEVTDDAADAVLPAEDVIIDEPAVDTLGAPAGTEGDTTTETLDPAADPALDDAVPLEEVPADMAPAAPDNASPVPGPDAGPAIDPAPPVEEVLEEPQPDAPGR